MDNFEIEEIDGKKYYRDKIRRIYINVNDGNDIITFSQQAKKDAEFYD